MGDLVTSAHTVGDLVWLPRHEIGHYPVKESDEVYDREYFDKYRALSETTRNRLIESQRISLVSKFFKRSSPVYMAEVGVGSGTFCTSVFSKLDPYKVTGIDTNEFAVETLSGLYSNHPRLTFTTPDEFPYPQRLDAIFFWDSLEHIPSPQFYNSKYVFVSCPVYKNAEHVLQSKHFRPEEHCWYWSEKGLFTYMNAHGYQWVYRSREEEQFGREDVGTYVFERI